MAKESPNIDDTNEELLGINDAIFSEEPQKLSLGQLIRKKLDLLDQPNNALEQVESEEVAPHDALRQGIIFTEESKEDILKDVPQLPRLEGGLPNSEEPLFSEDSENRELIREDIQEMKEPARRILEQIRTQIERGDYQLLIGDDASGRLPTLLFREIINAIYREDGRDEIPTRFISGSADFGKSRDFSILRKEREKKNKIEEFIEKTNEKILALKKVLILTDTIESGRSLQPVVEVLNERGIGYDIASLALIENPKNLQTEQITTRLGKNVILGGMTKLPKVYRNDYSGINKDSWDLHSHLSQGRLSPSSYNGWTNAPQPAGFVNKEIFTPYNEVQKLSDEDKSRYYAEFQGDPRVQEHLRLRMRIAREELHTVAKELLEEINEEDS